MTPKFSAPHRGPGINFWPILPNLRLFCCLASWPVAQRRFFTTEEKYQGGIFLQLKNLLCATCHEAKQQKSRKFGKIGQKLIPGPRRGAENFGVILRPNRRFLVLKAIGASFLGWVLNRHLGLGVAQRNLGAPLNQVAAFSPC